MTPYEQGFMDKCAELGVDPRAMLKQAALPAAGVSRLIKAFDAGRASSSVFSRAMRSLCFLESTGRITPQARENLVQVANLAGVAGPMQRLRQLHYDYLLRGAAKRIAPTPPKPSLFQTATHLVENQAVPWASTTINAPEQALKYLKAIGYAK